jgi:uncharacterized protein YdaU (DUF1376 family)
MSKAPAMPMYWDAYLADTTHLTTEEHGAYMLLLAAMWRRNAWVPDDDKDNARILGLTPAKWRKIKARLIETVSGFRVEDGKITQEKLQKTWENTQEKIGKNRSNGAKGGRPKSKVANNLTKANGSVSLNPNKSIPEPEPEPLSDDTNVSSRRSDKDQCFENFWEIWPSKKNKQNARKAWRKLTIDAKRAAYAAVRAGWFDQWQAASPDANPIHASTFLNSRRWEDQESAPKLRPIDGGKSHAKRPIAERLEARFTEMDCGEDRDPSEPLLSTGDRRPDRGGGDDGLDTGAVWLFSESDQRGM